MPGPNQHHVPQNLMLAGLFASGCSMLHCDHVLTSSASLTVMDKFINNSKQIVPYAAFWFGGFCPVQAELWSESFVVPNIFALPGRAP